MEGRVMDNNEKMILLAKLLVRAGERYSAAADAWSRENSPENMAMVRAAGGFSRELREDVESVMTVEQLYALAELPLPDTDPPHESTEDRLRRKLRKARDEIEVWRTVTSKGRAS